MTGRTRALAFTSVTVIDGTGAVLKEQTVVMEGDRIVSVGPAPAPSGARVIDSRGRTMIPGLCDAHAHLSYFKASALGVLVANGVTSVRDMGGLLSELDLWKAQTDEGWRAGPRLFRAGPMLNGKAFNEFQIAVADAAEARGAVRMLANAAVDLVKVHAAISRDAYFGVQEECRQWRLPFAGHMPRAITPEEASDAGQVSLEHVGAFGDRFEAAGVPGEEVAQALQRFRRQEAPALFEHFARNGTWFTPTLIVSKAAIHLGDHRPDPRDRYVSTSCKKMTEELLRRPSYQAMRKAGAAGRLEREFQMLPPLVELMQRSGVGLLAGTDFAASIVYPGFSLHEELQLLVGCGLSPMQALLAGTANAARALGQRELGTIRRGNRADVVLLEANPLEDIRNTQRIRAVVSRGRLLERAALDQLLAEAAREALTT